MSPDNFVSWLKGYFDLVKFVNTDLGELPALHKTIQNKLNSNIAPLEFCYWLQGFYELNTTALGPWHNVVGEHLNLVFNKVTTKTVELSIPEMIRQSILQHPDPYKFKPLEKPIWDLNKDVVLC
jgi:hypothetical protein